MHRFSSPRLAIWTLGIAAFASSTYAQGLQKIFGHLVREAAHVADDIPIRSVDDLIENASRSRVIRNEIEAESRLLSDVPQLARRSEAVMTLLRKTGAIDPVIVKRVGELEPSVQEAALVISRGGQQMAEVIPDLATRSRVVRAGGPELLAMIGSQEQKVARSVARDAARFQAAIEAGSVVSTTKQAVTLADYSRVVDRYGEATVKFWDKYVSPHWGKWIATGALAAYLYDPEGFQDALGNLTEEGFRRLTVLAGDVTASAIRGVGAGTGQGTRAIWDAFVETFFRGPNSVYSIIGILLIGSAFTLRFRRVRHWAGGPFRWLNEAPNKSHPGDKAP
jgi:hypothetical protein